MDYLRKPHMVCFGIEELEKIFENSQRRILFEEIDKSGHSEEEVLTDEQKKNEIVDLVVAQGLRKKEDIEIFAALDTCFSFYNHEDSRICFVLKRTIQKSEIKVKNLEDLKSIAEESTLTDFAIFSGGLRQFQLKQYRGELKTDTLFNFMKKKLADYGNNLGEVNLLILLQGKIGSDSVQETEIDFKVLHEKVLSLNLELKAEILLMHNEKNQFQIIHQVYPEYKILKKPFFLPSIKWQS